MAVTDLLAEIPFPPSGRDDAPDAHVEADADSVVGTERAPTTEGDGAPRTFDIEFPVGLGLSTPSAPRTSGQPVEIVSASEPETSDNLPPLPKEPPAVDADNEPARAALPDLVLARLLAVVGPLPSYAIALIGGLSLLCLALTVALTVALSSKPAPVAPVASEPVASEPIATVEAPAAYPIAPTTASPATDPPRAVSPSSFPADPLPIPIDLLTRLEAASNETLDVELARLLDAMQHGFGSQSARLEPTLRSYVYRMASRFEWNPDAFRIAVTAPSADLAEARAALLADLFDDAVASGRLQIGTGTGPHALTLVTE